MLCLSMYVFVYNMFYIYTLTDPNTSEVRYVGKTNNLRRRMYLHIAETKTSKTHKANWIKSLIDKNQKPVMDVLEICNEDDWVFLESYWISQFRCWGFNLCNLTNGGDGVKMWTDEMRKKMSEVKTGCEVWNKGVPMSDIVKEKLSKAKIGCESAFKGKSHTDEFKISKSRQMKEYYKDNKSNMFNKKHSYKSIELMSKNCRVSKLPKTPVLQFNLDGVLIKEWLSVVDAGNKLNIVPSNIRKICKSGEFYRIVGGFKWKYKENL